MSSRRIAPLVRHGIFPATLAAALFATHAMLARGTAPQAVIVIWFGLMPFVALLERLMPRHPEWNRSHDDRLTDSIYLPASLVVAGGLSALWGGFHVFLAGEITRAVGAPVWPDTWPIAA